MTDAGTIRYDLLRDAITANPGAQWHTETVMSLFRADHTPLTRKAARNLLAALETAGHLARVERTGMRYWLARRDEVAA